MNNTLNRVQNSTSTKLAIGGFIWLLIFALAFKIFPGTSFFFPFISLWANISLFITACAVLKLSKVRFDIFHVVVILVLWAASFLYFYWALNRRNFIYIWDYSNYLTKQYSAEGAFLQSPSIGFHFIFDSFAEDYTNFITLFLDFPFCLTDRTGDSFAFCQVFSIVPTLLMLLAGLVIKVGQILHVKNRFYFFLIGLTWTWTFPFLRMSAMLSQPDWFGLIFGFSILLLTLDYRFDKFETSRFLFIFLATAAIILSRRWYLYFVVSYYFSYVMLLVVSTIHAAKRNGRSIIFTRLRNLLLFGLTSLVAMVILFWPMISHILSYDYAGRYSYYDVGGLLAETIAQLSRLGVMNFVLIILGYIFTCKNHHLFALPCLASSSIVLGVLLFTRVQNTGSHQMLLFIPGWFILFLLGAAAISETINHHTKLKLGFWVFTIAIATSVRCSPLTILALPDIVIDNFPLKAVQEFVKLDRLIYDRKDIGQVKAIAEWISTHCEEGEIAYMIPHDMLYCPDHFKNCLLPEMPINSKLAHGFSIPGTHNFPMEFFAAKYVLTATPFPQTFVGKGEMSIKLNERFLAGKGDTFRLKETFDMGNGTTFTIWERLKPATRTEIEYYLDAFQEENAKYPEMFTDIAEAWMQQRGL